MSGQSDAIGFGMQGLLVCNTGREATLTSLLVLACRAYLSATHAGRPLRQVCRCWHAGPTCLLYTQGGHFNKSVGVGMQGLLVCYTGREATSASLLVLACRAYLSATQAGRPLGQVYWCWYTGPTGLQYIQGGHLDKSVGVGIQGLLVCKTDQGVTWTSLLVLVYKGLLVCKTDEGVTWTSLLVLTCQVTSTQMTYNY